ncbi:MAG: hypothetical protein IT327_19790 [Anaerolineae bacterium]|nr:hypothetical protein [Anaerolineae bacterium]
MSKLAKMHEIMLCFGLIEQSEKNVFDGALIVDSYGELLAESPHGTDEPLIWDSAPSKHFK